MRRITIGVAGAVLAAALGLGGITAASAIEINVSTPGVEGIKVSTEVSPPKPTGQPDVTVDIKPPAGEVSVSVEPSE